MLVFTCTCSNDALVVAVCLQEVGAKPARSARAAEQRREDCGSALPTDAHCRRRAGADGAEEGGAVSAAATPTAADEHTAAAAADAHTAAAQ